MLTNEDRVQNRLSNEHFAKSIRLVIVVVQPFSASFVKKLKILTLLIDYRIF